jgi:hypothetical protein
MSESITYTLILDKPGAKTFVMPPSFWPDIEIHCWGAGGGSTSSAKGGGGGYAYANVNISAGDTVTLQIGQPGLPNGAGGVDDSYRALRGGNSNSGAGGGGATWVAINNNTVCGAAGGGGGSNAGVSGMPGGIFPGVGLGIYAVTLSYAWNSFMNNYAVWGSGEDYTVIINFPTTGTYTFNYAVDNLGKMYLDGSEIISYAGFSTTTTYTATVTSGNHTIRVTGVNTGGPAGVAAQILKPDSSELWNTRNLINTSGLAVDSRGGDGPGGGGGGGFPKGGQFGGRGGQNFGNVMIAGSGSVSGGKDVSVYPNKVIGDAGYPGYIAIVFRKRLNILIKNPDSSGDWVNVVPYVKVPIRQVPSTRQVPDRTVVYSSLGITKAIVPPYVFSITVTGHGGGGSGGIGDGGKNNEGPGYGGGGSNNITRVYPVTPGQELTINVGAGAAPGTSGGLAGYPTTITGTGVNFNAAGGGGGSGHPGWGGAGESFPGSGGVNSAGGQGANGAGAGGYPGGGASTNGGANGGDGGPYNMRQGTAGQNGKVTVLYTGSLEPITITTGGWKPIERGFVKIAGQWKPLLPTAPFPLFNWNPPRIKANIIISADTNDYNLYSNLPAGYREGLMDVDVWVLPNVAITGNVTSTAFTIDNFATGDVVRLINYGTIQGRGGQGGNGSYNYNYTAPAPPVFNSKGQQVSGGKGTVTYTATAPATAGSAGGTGLVLISGPIILENRGVIAGGGGGGGGGGLGAGGRGGGGAGYGVGFNNGTLTSGGAGQDTTYDGGNGGGRGQPGSPGQSGAAGGASGAAINGIVNIGLQINSGSIIGPRA